MEVEGSKTGERINRRRKNPERHDRKNVRLQRRQIGLEGLVLQVFGLEYNNSVALRGVLDSGGSQLPASAGWLVRNRHDGNGLVARIYQCVERGHREVGRAHENDSWGF